MIGLRKTPILRTVKRLSHIYQQMWITLITICILVAIILDSLPIKLFWKNTETLLTILELKFTLINDKNIKKDSIIQYTVKLHKQSGSYKEIKLCHSVWLKLLKPNTKKVLWEMLFAYPYFRGKFTFTFTYIEKVTIFFLVRILRLTP